MSTTLARRGPTDSVGARRRRTVHARTGWLFALPTAIFVVLLFLVPLGLVFQMAASDWPLLGGNQGWNVPDNFVKVIDNRFFLDSVVFTLKYTVIATVLLIGLGLGLAGLGFVLLRRR